MGNLHRRIRNFAIPTVAAAAGRQGEFLLQKCSGRCVHNHSGYTLTILKRTTLVFAQKEYCLIFSDIDVWTFQSKAGSTNIGGAFAAAQIAGFNDQVVKFSGTTTLIATFQPGYEGFQLSQLKFVM
jgi:hypothetical protein